MSFNTGWPILYFILRGSERPNLLISCQPMLKLTTQYGFHVLFRVSYVQILVTVMQSITNVFQTNHTSTSGMNEE